MSRYGWRPDTPDKRDHIYKPALLITKAKLPTKVDLRSSCPPIANQGQLGSCTGNAIAFLYHFEEIAQKIKSPTKPSRLFIYYCERFIEHTIKVDAGAELRHGMKALNKWGVPSETTYPYKIERFADTPSKTVYDKAAICKLRTIDYSRIIQTLTQMKTCLAIDRRPFCFGFSVYSSFESKEVAKTGIMPIPAPTEELLGGHAVAAVGYDDAKKYFIIRNSWGKGWGDKGYFYMPYAFITDNDFADDFWTIRSVTAAPKLQQAVKWVNKQRKMLKAKIKSRTK